MLTPTGGPPSVSVLMPVRNGGPYLAAALDSILCQHDIAFEVICVDDGSTDESWPTICRYAARHPLLRPVRATGRGISDALNQAAALARGVFLARMDADDISLPGRLAAQARHLAARPELVVLGSQALVIDAEGAVRARLRVPVGTGRVHAALELSSPLIHPTVMMRAAAFQAVGGYRSGFDGAEDYDLWLRMAREGRLDNLAQPLHCYRRHTDQQTARAPFRQARLAALAHICNHAVPEAAAAPPAALCRSDPGLRTELRYLTCAYLANNGGTLRPTGARYLEAVISIALTQGERAHRRRLALASVRHRLQLMRNGRGREALAMLPTDIARWRMALFGAVLRHMRALWHCRRGWPTGTAGMRSLPFINGRPGRERACLLLIFIAMGG